MGLIVRLLLVDLVLFHREAHEASARQAVLGSVVWISIGVASAYQC